MNGRLILFQVLATYLFAVVGGAISAMLRLSHEALCALISLAAGSLLGVTLISIFPEALQVDPWWMVILAAATGYGLFFFVSKYVHHVCPACAASHFDADAARHFRDIAVVLLVALTIHSTSDGITLGVGRDIHSTAAAGWSLFLALCVHKLPEGLALGSLLVGAGFSRSATFAWVAATEATTLAGGAIGYFLLSRTSTAWLGLIMAHVGGGFLFLAAHAILGELVRHGKQLVIASFLVGIALIGVLNLWLRLLGL